LDFNADKTYFVPGLATISIDEIMFQEFNVVNAGDSDVLANRILLIVGYERPLLREPAPKKSYLLGGR
jgi:hypothetical protein